MDNRFLRNEWLLGKEAVKKLEGKKVMVMGLGGVGSFCAEALVRSGVGKITLVDKDTIDITNLNRQLFALNSTIGKEKAFLAKERALDINPALQVNAINEFVTKENIPLLIDSSYDYIVDAIDTITSKLDLIEYCYKNDIKIISSMGMGNRLEAKEIGVCDIYKTYNCPLAKVIRKELKNRGIKKLKVVYSKELPKVKSDKIASMIFTPSVAGIFLANEVIKDLLSLEK